MEINWIDYLTEYVSEDMTLTEMLKAAYDKGRQDSIMDFTVELARETTYRMPVWCSRAYCDEPNCSKCIRKVMELVEAREEKYNDDRVREPRLR